MIVAHSPSTAGDCWSSRPRGLNNGRTRTRFSWPGDCWGGLQLRLTRSAGGNPDHARACVESSSAVRHIVARSAQGIGPQGAIYGKTWALAQPFVPVLRGPRRVGKSVEVKRVIAGLIHSGVQPPQIIHSPVTASRPVSFARSSGWVEIRPPPASTDLATGSSMSSLPSRAAKQDQVAA